MLTLADLCEALTGEREIRVGATPITSVVVDSRECVAGSVFVALQGEFHDGHEFIGDALARGAIAIIAEARASAQGLGGNLTLIDVAGLQPSPRADAQDAKEPSGAVVFITPSSLQALQKFAAYWRRKFPELVTIGVTGSVGKSSTKELIATVLKQKFSTLKTEGNLNNEIGVPLTLLRLNESHERAVLEMGMYDLGEIRTLCEIAQPLIGVVTNVGPVHLERLGTVERIAEAKSELVQALPPGGRAILNGDDPHVRAMHSKSKARVIYYGLKASDDLWADQIESHGLEGIEFTIHYGEKQWHVNVPLLGRHSVETALAATAVGLAQELTWGEILAGLQDNKAQVRLLAVPGQNEITLLDDSYNASPHSSLAALNLMSELSGRKIAVLGDMLELGSYEEEGHRIVGRRAAEVVDVIIAVGTRGKLIGEAAQQVGHARVHFADDNATAAGQVNEFAQSGDTVLVKGSRGAHMEDIVAALSIARDEEGQA